MPNKPRMLEGYRVLDFSQFVAGPTCSRILAEMGAEVIKVEIAPEGDRTRSAGLKPLDGKLKSTTHSTSLRAPPTAPITCSTITAS